MEKEVSEEERKLLVKNKYLSKIDHVLRKDNDAVVVREIIRGFFTEALKLDYQFTYEELSDELSKIYIKPNTKRDIEAILDVLIQVEFNNKTLEPLEVKTILIEFRKIVDALIYGEHEQKKSFLEKIFTKKEIPTTITPEINIPLSEISKTTPLKTNTPDAEPEENTFDQIDLNQNVLLTTKTPMINNTVPKAIEHNALPMIETQDETITPILQKIEEAYLKMSYGDLLNAKDDYRLALQLYHKLTIDQQQQVYFQLYDLFLKLNH